MVPEITPEEASMVKPAGSPEAVKVRASPGSISAALTRKVNHIAIDIGLLGNRSDGRSIIESTDVPTKESFSTLRWAGRHR